jgi:hypothetical protein
MGGNRNKRGGRELSSAHPYGGGKNECCIIMFVDQLISEKFMTLIVF